MKNLITLLIIVFTTLPAAAQLKTKDSSGVDKTKEVLLVEAACGQCRLGLKGTGCDLAIRVNGKAYFVDGTDIDAHGDAHADDGFCNAIRKAWVQGDTLNHRFKARYFKLAAAESKME